MNIDKNFISFKDDEFEIYFSIGDRDYNKNIPKGRSNIQRLKEEYNLQGIKYLSQVHSEKVIEIFQEDKDVTEEEGDALVTNLTNVGIGVFYADCVPVILYCKKKKVMSAVHSGWKGTYGEICKNAIKLMTDKYYCKVEDIKCIVGPHIRQCCYEISEELRDKFLEKFPAKDGELFNGRNLSLEKVILITLKKSGIIDENITTLNLCTCCESKVKLHSYRRDGIKAGRCYSYIVKK